MGQITSLFVHKVLAQADPGLDRVRYLGIVGIDPDQPVDPKVMVSDTDYYRFFEALAMADPDGLGLPLRTGASMRTDEYGAFGLAWKSAPDLRASCERAERYAQVLTSVASYELRDADEGVYFHLHREGDRSVRGLCLSNEATIASMVAIIQEVTTAAFKPEAVYFRHGAPDSISSHEQHFGCPVHFDSGMDAVLASTEAMRAPNRVGDPAIVRFFDAHLEDEVAKLKEEDTLERRVRSHIAKSLSQGVPGVTDVASQLGMSGRTLQRQLADRGATFQKLVDQARRELAERLLADTSYPLAEVAFLTGFSEQSAFNRAFKRWAGQTPRSFRLKA